MGQGVLVLADPLLVTEEAFDVRHGDVEGGDVEEDRLAPECADEDLQFEYGNTSRG